MNDVYKEDARAELGSRLGGLRRAAGLSQQRMAQLLTRTQSGVSRIETGQLTPSAADIQTWAKAIGREVLADLLARRERAEAPTWTSDYREERAELGWRLRSLRRAVPGLTRERMEQVLGASQSRVSKLETGRLTPSEADLEAWAQATNATRAVLADLLARRTRVEVQYQRWQSAQRRQQGAATARMIRVFQPLVVPPLLQTADYAHHQLTALAELHGWGGVKETVAIRMRLQADQQDPNRSWQFVITEAALRARVCPLGSMIAQLEHIASAATLPNVSVGIVPWASELAVAPMAGFELHDLDLLTIDTPTGQQQLRDHDAIMIHRALFKHLDASADHAEKAHALLAAIIADLRRLPSRP